MTAARRQRLPTVLCLAALLLGGCGKASGVADTRRTLEGSGYRDVEVTVRTGGGIDVVLVGGSGTDADRAAQLVWTTMPVRFDQLVVTLGTVGTSCSYEALADRFGPRDPSLDRRQVSDEVVRDGLDLMILLTVGPLLSVGAVVTVGFVVVRAARRGRDDQVEGPISGLGDASPAAGDPVEAEGPGAIPS